MKKLDSNEKAPAMNFYPEKFLTGTFTFTHEQCGKYIRLLCLNHQKGPLSAKIMESIIGPEKDIEIYEKFTLTDDGTYTNARVQKEIEKREIFRENQRKRALKRWNNEKEDQDPLNEQNVCRGNAMAMPEININTNTYTNTNTNKNKKENKEEIAKIEIWPTFEDFWNLYDKKRGKAKAKEKFSKLPQKVKEEIMAYIPEYKKANQKQFMRDPERFISKETWKDEIINQNEDKNELFTEESIRRNAEYYSGLGKI
jgi:hypothetical protein